MPPLRQKRARKHANLPGSTMAPGTIINHVMKTITNYLNNALSAKRFALLNSLILIAFLGLVTFNRILIQFLVNSFLKKSLNTQ